MPGPRACDGGVTVTVNTPGRCAMSITGTNRVLTVGQASDGFQIGPCARFGHPACIPVLRCAVAQPADAGLD